MKFNAHSISPREIVKQRGCSNYLINKRAYLMSEETEKLFFYKKWLSEIKLSAMAKKDISSLNVNAVFDNYFKRSWYEIPQAYITDYEKNLVYAERFISYFQERNLKVLAVDVPCEIETGCLEWQNVQFNKIADTCDFVAHDPADGKIHVIKVVKSMDYSMKARKQTNKPVNAPELILLKASFIEKYPDCVCELWSIKSSQDSGTNIDTSFKSNVVLCDFNGFDTKEALKLFMFDVMAMSASKSSCENCIYSSYCSINSYREEISAETDKEKSKVLSYTEEQMELIEHVDGPMKVLAIPGAGKTAALVARCKRLVEKGVDAKNILLVSFTKKACTELSERLRAVLGNNIPKVLTLNSFGNEILVNNRVLMGKRYKLASEVDGKNLIKELMPSQVQISGVSYDGLYSKYGLISSLYTYFLEIEKVGKESFKEKYEEKKDIDGIFSFYDSYRAEYQRRNWISYDDQIKISLNLLKEHPKISKKISSQYKYIMVDEYQDVNKEQADLVDTIAMHHQNLVVVGDDDQSIYGWRGGSNEFLINFEERFPTAKALKFCDNFRSTDKILSACQQLIGKNEGCRIAKTFIPHKMGDNKPCLFKNFSADAIPNIIRMANKAGFKNGDIGIIARKNKGVELISDTLNSAGIDTISPRDLLINDALYVSIRDVLSLAYNGIEDIPLYRLLRNLGAEQRAMVKISKYKGYSLYEQLVSERYIYSLSGDEYEDFSPVEPDTNNVLDGLMFPVRNAGFKLYNALNQCQSRKVKETIPAIAEALFGESAKKHSSLLALLDQAEERGIADTMKLLEFLNAAIMFSSTDGVDYNVSENRVNIMTAHASKGKEFPFVLVYGIEEFDEDEESTRLLFVAMSRAKKSLFLTEGPAGYAKLLPHIQHNIMVRANF